MLSSPLALVGIFISGLALNLTPCVYPMLSVTIALFSHETGRGEKHLGAAFGKALLYVAGMASTYSALGVSAALTGGFFGAAVQNQWVLLALALLMFALALSMFGLYEIQAPSFLLNWIGSKRRVGFIGIFLSGLFVGVFAAPCIGPPIVALLTFVGQTANPTTGFLVFFVLALGLGFPYLILGTFSGLLTKLPKSGEWLLWVKKVFGVRVIHGHDGKHKPSLRLKTAKANHTRRGFLGTPDHESRQIFAFRMKHGNQIRSVVHRDLRVIVEH